jgi:hypothetical protein
VQSRDRRVWEAFPGKTKSSCKAKERMGELAEEAAEVRTDGIIKVLRIHWRF